LNSSYLLEVERRSNLIERSGKCSFELWSHCVWNKQHCNWKLFIV